MPRRAAHQISAVTGIQGTTATSVEINQETEFMAVWLIPLTA
jgi:hypothetical protein